MSKHFLMVAGDPSADRHGAALAQALRRKSSGVRLSALGGDHLRAAVDVFVYPLVGVGGFGFLEPLTKIPLLWRLRRRIGALLRADRPDAIVLMDYYGFNIHIAELAASLKIPVIYYISPQVWASRPGRIQRLARSVARMLVIFPFEEALYRKHDVPVVYVGHPLLERLPAPVDPPPSTRVGLLPGSRRATVERHLPLMTAVADRLHRQFPQAQFIFFRPEELPASLYAPFVQGRPWLTVMTDPRYDERRRLTLALSVSGTAALENTLLGIPMVVTYHLSWPTYWIARRLIRVAYVSIPNLLADRPLVPERLQSQARPDVLAAEMALLLANGARRSAMREALLALRVQLKEGASDRAAEEILSVAGATAIERREKARA